MTPPPIRGQDRVRKIALATLVLAAAGVLAVVQTAHQRPGTDFHARWMAGHWFAHGDPLYQSLPGEREPSYPPFAAMVFQAFAWLPLRVAAALFYFVNLLLLPAVVILTRRIYARLWPEPARSVWPLVWAGAFSLQFFLNNLNLVQVNAALFVLCLWGIDAYLAGRDARAAAAFVGAAFIKLVPGVFVGWLLVRGRPRAALAAVAWSAVCLALPMVQRGPRTGVADLRTYYESFLGGFTGGVPAEYDRYTNQALGPAVHRLFRPPVAAGEWDYRIVPASEDQTVFVYHVLAAAIAVAVLVLLAALRWTGAPITVWEWSALFLGGHLLSGITWAAHLVTLFFVYYGVLCLGAGGERLTAGWRWFRWAAIGLMAVTGLLGRDLAGNALHHWIGGFSLVTWLMILVLAGCIARAWPGGARPVPAL